VGDEATGRPPRVLLGVGGGIAAYKSPELVRRLRDRGFAVRCALTPNAARFVSPLSLEVVSGEPVGLEQYLEPGAGGVELHLEWSAWADVLLIAPATAHTLAALALGLADNFLLTTALAFEGPVIVAPALHRSMWEHAAIQARLLELERRGVRRVGPVVGPLASGEVALGRMADVPDLVGAVESALARGELAERTFLVTAGPTFEPLDPVRFLGNRSSGRMGFAIAAEAARRGARVRLVAGPVALETPRGVERVDVETAREMESAVAALAADADVVVMAAAVADFRPDRASGEKLKKLDGVPQVALVRNPDILSRLSELAPRALRVGFAAETQALEREARRKLEEKDAHLMVANDVSRPDIGFGSEDNEVTVYCRSGRTTHLGKRPKTELARELVDLFASQLAALRREPAPVVR
jgi:phosphopantothenoylcysteine decarboxylase/phosphopantothenate--cysteine ligase